METVGGSAQNPLDIVPSSPRYKERGWDNLSRATLSVVALKSTNCIAALERIHRLMTPGVESPLKNPFHRNTYIDGIWTHDRPDGEEMYHRFQEQYGDRYINAALQRGEPIPYVILRTIDRLRDVIERYSSTTISLNPEIRGVLRNFGSRRIKGYPREPFVYATHQTNMGTDAENARYMAAPHYQWAPPHYFGLSAGLDIVYTRLGEVYDDIRTDTIEQKYQKETFFSLVGTKLIHPFIDATGRAFGGFTAISLQEMGISLTWNQVQTMISKLNPVSSHMLLELLRSSGVELIRGRQQLDMEIDHPFRQDYMYKLRVGLLEAIEAGIDPEGSYFPFIQGGAQVIREFTQMG